MSSKGTLTKQESSAGPKRQKRAEKAWKAHYFQVRGSCNWLPNCNPGVMQGLYGDPYERAATLGLKVLETVSMTVVIQSEGPQIELVKL